MKKKLGIITFHSAENYGAFLQVYAMQKNLEKYNELFDIEIIDYRPDYITNTYKIKFNIFGQKNIIRILKSIIISVITLPSQIKKKYRFNKCLKKLTLSKGTYYDNRQLNKSNIYDVVILGSDQIWNPMITKGVDKAYFGQGLKGVKKIIGYAVSLGVSYYYEKDIQEMKEYIPYIESIGLRESSSIEMLKQIEDREYNHVLDPTFLVDKKFWNEFSKDIKLEKYILVYQLESNDRIMEDAYKIAKEKGLKIVCFSEPSLKNVYRDMKIYSIYDSGPREFLGAIKNADIILTNSYHATCFSIIFNKLFFTYSHSKTSSRMTDLANILGFNYRIIKYGESVYDTVRESEIYDNSFFRKININLQEYRKKSEQFLDKNLKL